MLFFNLGGMQFGNPDFTKRLSYGGGGGGGGGGDARSQTKERRDKKVGFKSHH